MTIDNIHQLKDSDDINLHVGYTIFIKILDKIFGKHQGVLKITKELETEENAEFIKSHWKILRNYFGVPSAMRHNQKLVRQVIKYISDFYNNNNEIGLVKKIQFSPQKESYYDGTRNGRAVYYTLVTI